MNQNRVNGLFLSVILVLATPLNAVAVGGYFFTDLGSLGGAHGGSLVQHINSYGQVIGSSELETEPAHSFLWTPTVANGTTGSMIDLGSLPGVPAWVTSAWRINSRGQIVGLSGIAPYIWTPDVPNGTTGTMVIPAGLPSGPPPNFRGINDVGQVVGIAQPTGSGPNAVLWTPTTPNASVGSSLDLDDLPGGADFSEAYGINSFGQVAGDGVAASGVRAFLWTPSTPNGSVGAMIDLGDLPGGIDSSAARHVNSFGQVLGTSWNAIGMRTFLWTPTSPNGQIGSMVDTSQLVGATSDFMAVAINSTGQLAGSIMTPGGRQMALWTPTSPNGTAGTLLNVESVLDPTDIVGWSLLGAVAINERGQIAGLGNYDPDGPGGAPGRQRGFLLTPVPEPTTLVFIAIVGALWMLVARRQGG
jgi:probable HAF family extracellular repeat protein